LDHGNCRAGGGSIGSGMVASRTETGKAMTKVLSGRRPLIKGFFDVLRWIVGAVMS
jgi:hypothetical protein